MGKFNDCNTKSSCANPGAEETAGNTPDIHRHNTGALTVEFTYADVIVIVSATLWGLE